MVRDCAAVALAAVPAPARAQLGGRGARQRSPRAGPHGGGRQAPALARIQRRHGIAVEQIECRVDVVHVDVAADVGAPEPELPGCTQEVAERAR